MFNKEKCALCLHKHIKKSMPGIKVISDELHCLEPVHSSAGKHIGVIHQVLCFFYVKHNVCLLVGKRRLRVDRVRFISSFRLVVVVHAMFSHFPKTAF